jgi:hypothetical protein
VAPHRLYGVGWFNDKLEMLPPIEEVIMMTLLCCLGEAFFAEVCVSFEYVPLRDVAMVFAWTFI